MLLQPKPAVLQHLRRGITTSRLPLIASHKVQLITRSPSNNHFRLFSLHRPLKMPSETKDTMFPPGVGTSTLPSPSLDASTTSASSPLPTIAIISLGEMGLGIATLLSRYHYPLITSLSGRSDATKSRAAALSISDLSFPALLAKADIFLSIVPPSEALALAEKVAANVPADRKKKLVYLDLNALSPALSRNISEPIVEAGHTYIDGCILGFPPKFIESDPAGGDIWFRPGIPISGGVLPEAYAPFAQLLKLDHVSPQIGAASGLKMCFSSINKSLTAVTIQAYTTATSLGVLEPLRGYMGEYFPGLKSVGESSMVASQRKAYRWIKEMEEVGETFAEEGAWEKDIWNGVGGVFKIMANETQLGSAEGKKDDVEGVAEEMCKALEKRRTSV